MVDGQLQCFGLGPQLFLSVVCVNTQHPACKPVSPLSIPWSILFLFTQILSSSTTNPHIISSPISLPRHWEKSFHSPPPLWSPGPRCSHFLLGNCNSLLTDRSGFPCPEHHWLSNSTPQKSRSDPSRGRSHIMSHHCPKLSPLHSDKKSSPLLQPHPPPHWLPSPSGLAAPGMCPAHSHFRVSAPEAPLSYTLFLQKSLWLNFLL